MEISIRTAQAGDAAALAGLSAQLGYAIDEIEIGARLARVRARRMGEVFVSEVDGRVVGWTHVVPRLQLEDPPHAELAGLVVADGARSAGVGAALLAAAENWARAKGFALMRVRSNVVRERAHRFYERAGYCRVKQQTVFHKSI
ncbi:MAG: GNAT family N-acetyltransferase [Rudaea sp.]